MLPDLRTMPSALAVALAIVVLAPSPASACGPDFPESLLLDRGQTLGSLPEGMFMTEVAHLVTPRHAYPVVVDRGPEPDDAGSDERALYQAGDYAEVLALPPAERRHRSTWAAYMLGREGGYEHAIASYQQVRALFAAGFEDVGGLAASSLGQEARLHLDLGESVAAVRLYAEQAALGHPDGGPSLLFVVRDLIARGRERELLGDEVGQHLLAIYLATRGSELSEAQRERLWSALVAIEHLAGADQLAALAYQWGEWDRAAALAAQVDAPRSSWIRGKLALRAGKRDAADAWLARAAAQYRALHGCAPVDDDATDDDATDDDATDDDATDAAAPDPTDAAALDPDATGPDTTDATASCGPDRERDRVTGERVALAIADDRTAEALALAWELRATYPDDLNYVAERVASLDELLAFVATLDPWPSASWHKHEAWSVSRESMAALLGRRLLRAGRYDEGLQYLSADLRAPASAFGEAMRTAARERDPIERARALYTASQLARRWGLELLGTAHAPDWEFYEGQYDRFIYEEPEPVAGRTPGELLRVLASAPLHGQRFHYRHLAADLAEQAANLLPHRSQAFAATLCAAASYVRFDDDERVQRLWQQYVDHGPSVSMDFPGDCPPPQFERARRYLRHPSLTRRTWTYLTAPRRLIVAGLVIGGLGLLGLGLWWPRRRWRRFVARP